MTTTIEHIAETRYFRMLAEYDAAPIGRFRPVTLEELQAISAYIAESETTSNASEWSRAVWETDRRCCDLALTVAGSGVTVFVAQDEDGYYFAKETENV